MAVVLKRKTEVVGVTPPPAPPKEEALTAREEAALFDVGLGTNPAAKPVVSKEQFIAAKKAQSYKEGDKVLITNTLYSWVTRWKAGDTGTVVRYCGPVPEMKGDLRYGVLVVKLDQPREKGHAEVYLHAWEVEPR